MSANSPYSADAELYPKMFEEDAEYFYVEEEEESLDSVVRHCVLPSAESVHHSLGALFVLNFLCGFLINLRVLPERLCHSLVAAVGVFTVVRTVPDGAGANILFALFAGSYLLLGASRAAAKLCGLSRGSNVVKVAAVGLLVLCEYRLVSPEVWLHIRGFVMVLAMKLISLSVDIEQANGAPDPVQYFGYVLCGGNVMFGPWISFGDYLNLYRRPRGRILDLFRVLSILRALLASFVTLSCSNCLAVYMVGDGSNRWAVAYREAFTFRTSHYFVCYLSEAWMLALGFGERPKRGGKFPRLTVTEPSEIELPSSLATVVRKWNLPMHDFLKKYIYRSWLGHGRFVAIAATFAVSSLLHGLELRVSAVLLNIGLFSYAQMELRRKMARAFDACLQVRPCRECRHKNRRTDPGPRAALALFGALTVAHLAYLGVLMDPSTAATGVLAKWQHLHFFGHALVAADLLIANG